MKVRLGDIANERSLIAYTKVLRCEPAKAHDKFKLLRVNAELAPVIDDFQKVRRELLEKHGEPHPENPEVYHFPKLNEASEPQKDGEAYVRDESRIEAYMAALEELYAAEVEVTVFIDLDFVERNVELTTQELGLLAWLVEECHTLYSPD